MTPPNSSQGGENEGSGASADAATCSHPFGTKPASGLGAPRVDQAQHTPTPWRAETGLAIETDWAQPAINGADGEAVAVVRRKVGIPFERTLANAAFIVRACNSHDDLVEALNRLVGEELGGDSFTGVRKDHETYRPVISWQDRAFARDALSKARSEQGA